MKKKDSNKLKNTLFGIFISLIMVTSILSYVGTRNSNNSIVYNNYRFFYTNGIWKTKVNGYELKFYNSPMEVENYNNTNLDEIIKVIRNSSAILISIDTDSIFIEDIKYIAYLLSNDLMYNNILTRTVALKKNKYNVSIADCKNATKFVPVIILNQSNSTQLKLNNYCIIISSNSPYGLMYLRDVITYRLFNIIK